MEKQFLIVPTVTGSHHVIDLQLIASISPREEGKTNKSEIKLIGLEGILYSTETPLQIHERIKSLQPSTFHRNVAQAGI